MGKIRHMIYTRRHKGKHGFQFDITETSRTTKDKAGKKPVFRIFHATRKREPVGQIYLDYYPKDYFDLYDPDSIKRGDLGISEFGVDTKYRSKGIGGHLLKKAERIAKRNKKKRLVLGTGKNNWKAQKLYRKHGFKKINEYDRKLGNGKVEKSIMMAKEL